MSNIQLVIKSALESSVDNDRLNIAATLAANYVQKRELEAAGERAAASFAASILGFDPSPQVAGGASTSRGLAMLTANDPIKTILLAVAKQDRKTKQELYWGLDAARRSAAVDAYKAATEASTAEESAKLAAGLLGVEPYAGADASLLYEVGHQAIESFTDDSAVWESLQLLLAGSGQQTPGMCRFWSFDNDEFYQTICSTWGDVEAYLAPKR